MASLRSAATPLVLLLALAACIDPTLPRVGVPTLDDPGRDGYLAVTAGREHSCAIAADSTAFCWGSNEYGQLGAENDGTTCLRDDRPIPCRTRPVAVTGGLKFRRISAGGVHSCGLALDDRIYCWGDNLRGSLGDPALRASPVPVPTISTARFADVATGNEHTCGLRLDGVAVCWGANEWGQVGTGSVAASIAVPTATGGGNLFASISASGVRSCARGADGIAFCWGRTWVTRFNGEDVMRPQGIPSRIQTNLLFRELRAGIGTTCGVTQENQAVCWEANSTATIGDGSVAGSLSPQPSRDPSAWWRSRAHRFIPADWPRAGRCTAGGSVPRVSSASRCRWCRTSAALTASRARSSRAGSAGTVSSSS
jgi:alpha-tubulin suppressor-like RCC1 family protein